MALPEHQEYLGQYVIDEKLAQGGMAEIFKGRAMDPHGLARPVVIKRILPHIAASPEFVEMLVAEAKLAVQLTHGNIAQIYDLGKVGEDYFMVMEYVDGKSLSQIARRLRQTGQKIPVAMALYICSEIASGLDYMHRKTGADGRPLNIIHRDISPQNIIISQSGTIKIIDFGIAKAESQVSTTDSGVVKGKFAYMSPEHVSGDRLDGRTDVFSLNVILWELLTNQRLFKGKNNKETIQRVKRCRVPAAAGYREDIPKDVEKILKQALTKQRKHRYPAAHDLLIDLIRTLVQNYPEFAPKDLEIYLKQLFSGQWFNEELAAPTEVPGEPPTEIEASLEPTAMADPRVLKLRLKELESYDVPIAKPAEIEETPAKPEPPTQAKPKAKPSPPLQERPPQAASPRSISPGVKSFLFRWLPTGLVLIALGVAATYAFTLIRQWTEPPVLHPLPTPPLTIDKTTQKPHLTIVSAQVTVESNPAGARIYLNDRDTGLKTPATVKQISVGLKYRIGLYQDNYRYWEQEITPQKKETLHIKAILELNWGGLTILSAPEGASVWVENQLKGATPVTLGQLKPDQILQVRVTKEGYRPWEGETKIFAGRTQTVRAILERHGK